MCRPFDPTGTVSSLVGEWKLPTCSVDVFLRRWPPCAVDDWHRVLFKFLPMHRAVAEHHRDFRKRQRIQAQNRPRRLQELFLPPLQSTTQLAWSEELDDEPTVGVLTMGVVHCAPNDFRACHLASLPIKQRGSAPGWKLDRLHPLQFRPFMMGGWAFAVPLGIFGARNHIRRP